MKKLDIKNFVKTAAGAASAWAATSLSMVQVYANDWLDSTEKVDVSPGSLDANTLVNNALTLICAIIALGGIFTIVQGYQAWSTGRADENQANEAKGMRKMIAGIVEVAAPAVFAFLLNS